MTAGVVLVRGVAVGIVVHEVLADCGTGHGGDVLHWCRVGRRSRHDDRLLQNAAARERLLDAGNRGSLLANGDVDADDVRVLLVHDRVDGDCRLAGLAVADDQLTLATADGDHGVDGHETGLHRLAHRLARHDAGGLELDGATVGRVNRAEAVDGLAERVHDTAEHGVPDGDVHDAPGGAALVALLDGVDVAEQNGANLVLVQVLREAVHAPAIGGARELKQLAGHRGPQPGDVGDAIAHLRDDGGLLLVYGFGNLGQPASQRPHDLRRAYLICHAHHFRRRSRRASS